MHPCIRLYKPTDKDWWDGYVHRHPSSTLYHLAGWEKVIREAYGHKTYYLIALDSDQGFGQINGILPLVHIKSIIFGNALVSMPFLDQGGVLADTDEIAEALLLETMKIAVDLGAKEVELRHLSPQPLPGFAAAQTFSHKVAMRMELPEDADDLMRSFKSKLRSQIRKSIKEGCSACIGRAELLDEFYEVFCANMRDLGSPVHSYEFLKNILAHFPETKLCMVYVQNRPVAGSIMMSFKKTVHNPWASSLRDYSKLSPNMLLYWSMLEYACNHGYRTFDFGRSSPGEGTFKFKEQWGAKPEPLHWQTISLNGKRTEPNPSAKEGFGAAIKLWQQLPVPVTRFIGPMIRKYVSL